MAKENETKLHLRIITPEKTKVDEEVDMVIMRCSTGEIGILPGHQPHAAVLNLGVLRIKNNGSERYIAVYGGLVTVRDNLVTVLTGEAEWPEEVDLLRAHHTREQAELRLREKADDREILHDQALLRRALVQIEVSEGTLVGLDE